MLILKKEFLEGIFNHSKREFPNECCGILAGKDGRVAKIYETTNIDKSPSTYFMEPKEQLEVMKEIRNQGWEMIGIYHSHVASPAYPSAHDVELAFYPEASYVIITLEDEAHPQIRSFKIVGAKIEKEELKIE